MINSTRLKYPGLSRFKDNFNLWVVVFIFGISISFSFGWAASDKGSSKSVLEVQELKEEETFNKGLAYYKAGMAQEALYFFSEVLKENPDHKQARQMLEKILKEQDLDEQPPQTQKGPEEVREEVPGPLARPQEERPAQEKPLWSTKTKTQTQKIEAPKPEIKERPAILPLPLPGTPSLLQEKQLPEEIEERPKPEIEKKVEKKEVAAKPPTPVIPFLPELGAFEFANALNQKGEYEAAVKTLVELLEKYPQSQIAAKINLVLGSSYLKLKQYDQAIATFQKIIEDKEPLRDKALFLLAQAYQQKGELDKAKIEYLRLTTLLETPLPAPKEEEKGTKSPTAEEIGLATLLPPLPPPKAKLAASAHLEVGNIYQIRKEYRQALVEYQLAGTKYPQTEAAAEAFYYIGEIYDTVYQLRDYEKAVEAYNKLITNYPESKWTGKAKIRKEYLEKNYL